MADLFSDGFEGGNTNAWSSAVTDEGKLSVAEAAALHGTYGLSVFIDDTTAKYVQDNTPSNEKRYRVRFYVDPNGLEMAELDSFVMLRGYDDSAVRNIIVLLTLYQGEYLVSVKTRTDAGNYSKYTAGYAITDAPHCIEVDWEASSGVGQNDGWFSLWIDGVLKQTVTAVDNDLEEIDYIQFGAPGDLDAGTSGTFFLDDFASNNDGSEIGLFGFEYVGDGTFTFSGAGAYVLGFAYTGSGTFTYSGSYTRNFTYTGQTGKWSGVGMGVYDIDVVAEYEEYIDDLVACGFTKMKIFPPKYYGASEIAAAKVAVLYAVSKGIDVVWGYCAGPDTLTATNWPDYRQGILDAAQWSQDNGVFEFRLGNEDLAHNDDTTLTDVQLMANFKALATEVQAIFTNGNISYACRSDFIDDWIAAGIGDIDILASNIYMGGGGNYDENWKNLIDDLIAEFGVEGTYLTEFAPSWDALDDYSTDEAVQAAAVTEMIEYIRASGMTRAFFFCYANPYWFEANRFGALKSNGIYRQLWYSLLYSAGASFVYSGSAIAEKQYFWCTGAGSFNFSGEGICYKEIGYVGSGSFAFSGSAIQSYTWNYSCVASGDFTFGGLGTYLLGFSYVASGSLAFSGEGTCVFGVSYIGNGVGGFFFSGYADCSYETETENFIYAGQGEIHFSGDAVYSFTRFFIYSGNGELLFSGEAVVQKFNFIFTGSGILTYSGIARIVTCYNWTRVDKEKEDWEKVYREEEDWEKVEKE